MRNANDRSSGMRGVPAVAGLIAAVAAWALVCPLVASGGDWNPGMPKLPGFGPGFGKRGPEYSPPPPPPTGGSSNPGQSQSPGQSGNSGRTPEELEAQKRSQAEIADYQRKKAANDLNEEGLRHWGKNDWAKAVAAFQAALDKWPDNRVYQGNLKQALAALAYEKRLKEEQERRNKALTDMSECLGVLSDALADVKTSVACDSLAISVETGAAHRSSGQPVLTEASVANLRHAATGIVGMQKFVSQYNQPPQTAGYVAGANPLTDAQMAMLGNFLLYDEIGKKPSERDIDELLGLPPMDHGGHLPKAATRALQAERDQIRAALARFSKVLIDGCNEQVELVAKELRDDPICQKIKEIAALDGLDRMDPAIRQLWEQRKKQSQEQLFARFRVVQDRAMRQLGTECSGVFRQAQPSHIAQLSDADLKKELAHTRKIFEKMNQDFQADVRDLQTWTKDSQDAEQEAIKASLDTFKDLLTTKLGEEAKKIPDFDSKGKDLQKAAGRLLQDLTKAAGDYNESAKDRQSRLEAAQSVLQAGYDFLSEADDKLHLSKNGSQATAFGRFLVDYGYQACRWRICNQQVRMIISNLDSSAGKLEAERTMSEYYRTLVQEHKRRASNPRQGP
jgi:hypothetical protein